MPFLLLTHIVETIKQQDTGQVNKTVSPRTILQIDTKPCCGRLTPQPIFRPRKPRFQSSTTSNVLYCNYLVKTNEQQGNKNLKKTGGER